MKYDRWVAAAGSVVGHGALLLTLQGVPHHAKTRASQPVAIVDIETPAPIEAAAETETLAEAPALLEPPSAPPAPPASPTRPRRRAPVPAAAAPAPSAEEKPSPALFSGLTLTNESEPGASDFAVAANASGTGVGGVGRETTAAGSRLPASAQRGGGGAGTRLVLAGNLSRQPRQPGQLGALLDRLYPKDARSRGQEGSARVRARITAQGSARVLSTLTASTPAFGQACAELLRRSRGWGPGLDRRGKAVDSLIDFPCRFEIRP